MPLTRYARTRLTGELHAQLLEDASLRRVTVSRLIRALLEHHYRGTRLPKPRASGPAEALARELNRIGINLNQIAHVANATRQIDLATFDDLTRRLIDTLERL